MQHNELRVLNNLFFFFRIGGLLNAFKVLENIFLACLKVFIPKVVSCAFRVLSISSIKEAVLTSTHNLCFGAKIRKIGIPLQTPVLLYKSGV